MSTVTELNYLGPVGTERFIAKVKALLGTKQPKEKYGKLVVFGDSIGAGAGNDNYSFVDILGESGAFKSVTKHCVSSATIGPYQVTSSASGYSLVEQIERYSSDVAAADIIICEYEYNDAVALLNGNITIGSVEDSSSATTVCGYTRKAFERIFELNPYVRIIWIPIARNDFPWLKLAFPESIDTVDTCLLFEATVLRIASEYGCSVISAYTSYNIDNFIVDTYHPNTDGHKLIAEKVLHNMYAECEYNVPERMVTATSTGVDASFSKILALAKAGVSLTFKYMYGGSYPNTFSLNYFYDNRMDFSTVTSYDGTNYKVVIIKWFSDGTYTTEDYDLGNSDSNITVTDTLKQQMIDAFWDGKLYDTGNECDLVTGGWTPYAIAGSSYLTAAAPTVTKGTSYIDISQTTPRQGGALVTVETVNVTQFSKLSVDLSNIALSGSGTVITIGVSDSNDNIVASTTISASATSRSTYVVDVADLTGDARVLIHLGTANSGSASCRFHSAKLRTESDAYYAGGASF